MATFHSTDRWFVSGLITIILHLLILSSWYNLNNVLYSWFWIAFSAARVVSALLLIILHSKLSTIPLLLAAALWNLFGLIIVSFAVNRTYLRAIKILEIGEQRKLRKIRWIQLVLLLAIPLFAASTGCWAHASNTDIKRVFFRNVGRILNWTGCALLLLGLVLVTASGLVLISWSRRSRAARPAFIVACGIPVSTPFILARFIVQMFWMRRRNTLGADFGFHVGGGVVMEVIVSLINLFFAWYTLPMVNNESFCRAHNLQLTRRERLWGNDQAQHGETRRNSLMRNAFSVASVSTIASFSRATSFIGERKVDRSFPSKFSVRATGRTYRMEDQNVLIRNIRTAHKALYTKPDVELAQKPFSLNPITTRADAQRAIEQIAKLLCLFVLWDSNGQEDEARRRIIETDITSIWYEDIAEASGYESPRVQVMHTFDEISQVILGHERKRPQEQMLERVFLHFFDRLRNHDVNARAGACLFALRLTLKQEINHGRPPRPCLTDVEEAGISDIDEEMWHKFDQLAAEQKQEEA